MRELRSHERWARLAAAAVAVSGIATAVLHPFSPIWGAAWFLPGLAVGALAPRRWLLVLPFVIVAADFYPLTGSLRVSEADLFSAGLLVVLLWRWQPAVERLPRRVILLWAPLALSAAVSAIGGWVTLPAATVGDELSLLTSSGNALRVGEAFLLGIAFVPFVVRALETPVGPRDLLRSIHASAWYVALMVLLERAGTVGIADLTTIYRATGPFASMHIGGQHIDAYWVLVLPLLFAPSLVELPARQWLPRAALFVIAAYATVATLSRGLLAIAAMELLACVALSVVASRGSLLSRTAAILAGLGALAIGAVFVAVAWQPIASRLAAARADAGIRFQHVRQLADATMRSAGHIAVGSGLGTMPRTSAAIMNQPNPAELLRDENGVAFLRLRPGKAVYVEQWLPTPRSGQWTLEANLRGAGEARLHVAVCRKTFVQSFDCGTVSTSAGGVSDAWQHRQLPIDVHSLSTSVATAPHLPTTIALYASGPGHIDLAAVQCFDAAGHALLSNGDFRAGSSRWFFTSDDHLAWHAKNVWIHLFVEQGVLGVAAFGWLALGTCWLLARRLRGGFALLPGVLLVSLMGLLAIGMIESLLDTPWLTQFSLLLFAAAQAIALHDDSGQPRDR